MFGDALRHLAGDATYLYNQQMRYWHDTKPSLTRLAADRALSNLSEDDADVELRSRVQRLRSIEPLGYVHLFPDGPGDVPDEDDRVRLVIPPRGLIMRGGRSPRRSRRPGPSSSSAGEGPASTATCWGSWLPRRSGPRVAPGDPEQDGVAVHLRRAGRAWS